MRLGGDWGDEGEKGREEDGVSDHALASEPGRKITARYLCDQVAVIEGPQNVPLRPTVPVEFSADLKRCILSHNLHNHRLLSVGSKLLSLALDYSCSASRFLAKLLVLDLLALVLLAW